MPERNIADHLANERTLLSWVRTSTALMGFGVVIANIRSQEPATSVTSAATRAGYVGLAFVVVGLLTLPFAAAHYIDTRRRINAGDFHSLGRVFALFITLVLVLGLTCVYYLLQRFRG